MATGCHTLRRLLLAAAFMLPLMLAFSGTAQAQGSEATDLLKKGIELSRAGKHAEAVQTLRAALAKDPSNQDVSAALGREEYNELLSMLARGGDEEKVAKAILAAAAPILPDKQFDPAAMAEMVKTAVEGEDHTTRFEAQMTLARTAGEFAVPHLIKYLAGNNTDHKVAAHVTLMNRIGREAVLPLNEALQSDNASVRRFVAAELGTIGDERSLAALAEAVQTDGDADTKARALQAYNTVVARFPDANGLSAAQLYLRLAALYYKGVYRVKSFADRPLAVWGHKGGHVQYTATPRHLYMLKLAEEAAHDSLRLEASLEARALLARILLSEHLGANAVAAVSEEEMDQNAAASLRSVPGMTAAMGWATLARALEDSLDDGDHVVAVALLGIMPSVYGSADFTTDNPVVRATSASANSVRLAAAEAVLRFNAARRITAFPDPEGFLSLVAGAVGEIIPRQILVIDANDARRNKLLTGLQGAKYVAFDARSGTDGIVRALRFAGLDMILVAHDLPDIETLQVIKKLKGDQRTANVPRAVILSSGASSEVKALYENTIEVDEGTGAFDAGKVKGLFTGQGPDVKARYSVSASMLDALAHTDSNNTLFNWGSLTETLLSIVNGGEEIPSDPPVRMNAVRALGNLGDASAVENLAAFFGKTGDAGAKAAAGNAIASLARRGTVSLSDGAFKALLGGTQGGGEGGDGAAVQDAAFAALGSSSLSEAQSLEVTKTNRPG
ncbi:MAG: HEAT repeat domain-containing protein [Planctomycetota bacterium]